jgi:hypothetical protein
MCVHLRFSRALQRSLNYQYSAALLTIAPLTLTLPFALGTYMFIALTPGFLFWLGV